jgi:hypothetical protein
MMSSRRVASLALAVTWMASCAASRGDRAEAVTVRARLVDSGVNALGVSSVVALEAGFAVLVHNSTRDELLVVDSDLGVAVAERPRVKGCRGEDVEPLIDGIYPRIDGDEVVAGVVLSCFGWNPNEVELWSLNGTAWAESERDRLFLGFGITVDSDRVGDVDEGFDLVYDRDEYCAFDPVDTAAAPTCGPWSEIDPSCRSVHDVIRLSSDANGVLVVYDTMEGPLFLARLNADGVGLSSCDFAGPVADAILGAARSGSAAMFVGRGDDVVARVGDESDAAYRFVDDAGETISGVNGVTSAIIDGCERIVLTTTDKIGLTDCLPAPPTAT